MKKLLLLLFLIPNLVMGYDDYGQPHQGGGDYPDFILYLIGIGLIFFIISEMFKIIREKIRSYNQKMKALRADKKFRESEEKVGIFGIVIVFLGFFIFLIMLSSGNFGNIFSSRN